MEKNCKYLDRERILRYLEHRNCVAVDELIEKSGVEKLRVFPILAELTLDKQIFVVKESVWGAPEVVELNKSNR